VICDAWDVVTVPFPFTETAGQKRRPALVLSVKSINMRGHSVMAMITTSHAVWPSDTSITNLASCGLSQPCVVRLKLFTLDNRLIVKCIGFLASEDRNQVASAVKSTLPF